MKVLKISAIIKNILDMEHILEIINNHFVLIEKTNNINMENKELFTQQFNKENSISDKLNFFKMFGEISKLYKFEYTPFYNGDNVKCYEYNLFLPKYERTIN